jgi:cation-transporting ATPase 13A1
VRATEFISSDLVMLDRLMKLVFCPNILFASVKGTTWRDVFGLARTVLVIYFIMTWILGNEDVWEDLMIQEGRLEELGINATENATNATDILEGAAQCIGEACAANLTESVAGSFSDEF